MSALPAPGHTVPRKDAERQGHSGKRMIHNRMKICGLRHSLAPDAIGAFSPTRGWVSSEQTDLCFICVTCSAQGKDPGAVTRARGLL